ncbi:thermonuclease family protein [Micrococcus endophyticus]|uniref:Endonuclease YncB(Thermonuclease family) n=1 Tax=Micrococcus endophyticus TaxID=455343 RepID=A0A7W9N183_9MICC|nr:nuclease [Micrococcus endophyticus]MBB5849074.1 endonuclease YncB(thermonuclease family) [Micrococcus endophyticus]
MTHVAARARVPKKGLLVFLVVAAVLLLLGALTVVRGIAADAARVNIVSVVDGNTVVVNQGGTQRTLVLAGVTSAGRNPEGLKVGPEFCMGEQSYAWLRDRLPQGAVASVDTSREGAPEGMESALVKIGGKTINVDMAEAGMTAPTGIGVDDDMAEEIAAANRVAVGRGVGLYDVEEPCTYQNRLYEAQFALDQIPKDAEDSIRRIDERSVEYAAGLDQVRLIQQEVQALDPENGTFADLAYSPARESLLAEADPVVEEGLQVLRDLNARRNEIAARG